MYKKIYANFRNDSKKFVLFLEICFKSFCLIHLRLEMQLLHKKMRNNILWDFILKTLFLQYEVDVKNNNVDNSTAASSIIDTHHSQFEKNNNNIIRRVYKYDSEMEIGGEDILEYESNENLEKYEDFILPFMDQVNRILFC